MKIKSIFYIGAHPSMNIDEKRNLFFLNFSIFLIFSLTLLDYSSTFIKHGHYFQTNNLLILGLCFFTFLFILNQKLNASKFVLSLGLILLLTRPFIVGTVQTLMSYVEHALLLNLSIMAPLLFYNNAKNKSIMYFLTFLAFTIQIYIYIDLENIIDEPLPTDLNEIAIVWVYLSIVIVFLFYIFGSTYSLYRNKVEAMNQDLKSSKEDLEEVHEEFIAINSNLENEINKRTNQLRSQNFKLADHAFDNAHIIRAPLSSVIGLVHLIKENQNDKEQVKEMTDMLEIASKQLEEAVKKVNNRIENKA